MVIFKAKTGKDVNHNRENLEPDVGLKPNNSSCLPPELVVTIMHQTMIILVETIAVTWLLN